MTTETRTYRGATAQEVLPQIRRELGDDAMIIRQREGLVGGIAGFFSKKCVEVEAKGVPADRRGAPTPAIPARRAFDATTRPRRSFPPTPPSCETPCSRR